MSDINELPNTLIPLGSSNRKRPASDSVSTHPRSVGRPLKRTAALRHAARERNSRIQLLVARRQTQTHNGPVGGRHLRAAGMSRIESLPHEIIQEIFFKADMEVNLARASRRLGEALSVESIYLSTIATAFFDDDTEGPIVEEYFKPAGYSHIGLEQKIRIQRNLMTCKWFNQERLEKCLPRLVHLKVCQVRAREVREQNSFGLSEDAIAHPYCHGERRNVLGTIPEAGDEKGLMAHYRAPCNILYTTEDNFHGRRRRPEQQRESSHPQMRQPPSDLEFGAEEKVGEQVWPPVPRIWTWKCWADREGRLHKEMDRGVSVLAVRVIPDKFLDLPRWTPENISILRLLRQGMRFVEHDQVLEISAEALFKGLRTALRQRNEEATLVLLELHYATMRVAAQVESEPTPPVIPSARQPRYHDLVGPFVHPLPRSLILDALPPEGSNREFNPMTVRLLSYMISEGIDSVEHRSQLRRLSRWAINASKNNNNATTTKVRELGRWIMGQMFRTIDHGLGVEERLFVNGRLATIDENTDVPWPWASGDDTTFTKRLGYDTDGEVTPTLPPTAPDGGPCGGDRPIPLTWDPPDPMTEELFLQDDDEHEEDDG
ncbi:hypothetical protein H2204_008763 [Knufia peltigerae]|uniref:Uncharacterized protein n=1 Tax=Knufia peltigerae TaxID=1002370 RepID=A0AA39CVT5_9EURO|nr:hypothetical protein H2204_008763 [Knufia peltigerae]